MDTVTLLDNEDTNLITEMKEFENTWIHKRPCKEYSKTKYCVHLERAQSKKFKDRVRSHLAIVASFVEPVP